MTGERKLVTVLFADVVGSTSLGAENEPEVVRDVMARYFERMKTIAETHGGTVEKFIGDAVMVVFGVPKVHDDDAERAVRCALAMQETMTDLNRELGMELSVRVGVNSGRAVTGGAEGLLVTGDVVNVAARLQQNGEPGKILVGSLTEELSRRAIEYQARNTVVAKGKVERIEAFTVVRARSAVPRPDRGPAVQAPLVGREREVSLLVEAFGRVNRDHRPHVLTVLGSAGVGKSRLVQEALGRIEQLSPVRVLQGRCLPYGRGITYWPLIEVLREDMGIGLGDDRETAIRKLARRLSAVLPVDADRGALQNRLSVLLGLTPPSEAMADVPAARVDPELRWAVRLYFQAIAIDKPLVIVVDDLQWAEPVLVRLLEQTGLRLGPGTILLLCVARPELLEAHPSWGSASEHFSSFTLNPLSPRETSVLISRVLEADALPPQLRERLVERSEGNPLFCEEFLRTLIDELRIDGRRPAANVTEVRVPESIHAVLAARLDGLPDAERQTLQAASIVGERFTAEQLRAVLPGVDIDNPLEDLLLKGLVQEAANPSDPSELRFKHLLIRDVAYDGIPKDARADFHERFERHMENFLGDRRGEFIEILAHHAERAFALSRETRLGGTPLQRRAERALQLSVARAETALRREDLRVLAASVALGRLAADACTLDDARMLRLELLEAENLRLAARFPDALASARAVASKAAKTENQSVEAAAHLCVARIELIVGDPELALSEAAAAARLYRLAGDASGELDAEWPQVLWRLGNLVGWETLQEGVNLADRAAKAGAEGRAADILLAVAIMSVNQGYPEQAERAMGDITALGDRLGLLSRHRMDVCRSNLAMLHGDLVKAEAILRQSLVVMEDIDGFSEALGVRRMLAELLLIMGRYAEAETVFERALRDSEQIGDRWNRAELLARRAMVAIHRQDLESAERYAQEAVTAARPNDPSAQSDAAYAWGQLRSAQRRFAEAEAFYRRSVEVLGPWAFAYDTAQAYVGVARFFAERGKMAEATPLLDAAQAWLEKAGYSLWLDEISQIRQLANVASPG